MTREKAIQVLNEYDVNFGYHTAYEIADAMELAINALKQEPCEDCISREDLREPRFITAENDYQKGWNDALNSVYENAPSIQPKTGVLDKIRAEIEEHAKINQNLNTDRARALCWCLEIIDKYKESEE